MGNIFCLDKSRSQGGSDSKDIIIHRDGNSQNIAAQTFTFRELAAATKNFRQDCLLGEGGFGRVYKGRLENGQVSLSETILAHWHVVCNAKSSQFWVLSGLIEILIKMLKVTVFSLECTLAVVLDANQIILLVYLDQSWILT